MPYISFVTTPAHGIGNWFYSNKTKRPMIRKAVVPKIWTMEYCGDSLHDDNPWNYKTTDIIGRFASLATMGWDQEQAIGRDRGLATSPARNLFEKMNAVIRVVLQHEPGGSHAHRNSESERKRGV
jgi:hypothetical protein